MAGKKTSTTKAKSRQTTAVKTKSTVVESAPMPVVRQRKTIFRAGTLIAVLLLLAMVELSVYLKQQKEKTGTGTATAVSEAAPIFKAEDGVVTSIEVKPTEGEVVKVARDEKNAWVLELPTKTEADQAAAEAAATQVSALKVVSQIDNGKSPSIFGLDKPAYIITIEFKNGGKHTLEIGDATPSNSGYYVRVDKGKMVIADLSGIDALLQLGFSPPYLNTPTPTAIPPTETPVTPTEATSTPTP
jgi:hypothetical protein